MVSEGELVAEGGSARLRAAPLVAVAAFAVFAQGLMLLNDGVFWDGWLEWTMGRVGDVEAIRRWFVDSGLPQFGWFHVAIATQPSAVLLYHAIGFASVVVTGLVVAWCSMRYAGVPAVDAALAGCIVVGHRVATTIVGLVTVPYFMSQAAFALAALLTFVSMEGSAARRIGARVVAAVLLLAAFGTKSTLVWGMGLWAIAVVVEARPWSLARLLTSAWKRGELFVLPPVFYFASAKLAPAGGPVYSGYNALKGGDKTDLLELFLDNGVVRAVTDAVPSTSGAWWFAGLAVSLVVGLAFSAGSTSSTSSASSQPRSASAAALWLLALACVVAAVLPYIAVGKAPKPAPWDWRHALMVPVALAAVALAVLRTARMARMGRTARVTHAGALTIVAFTAFLLARGSQEANLIWLGRAAQDKGIIVRLKSSKLASGTSIVWVKNETPRAWDEHYRFYEWTGMFYAATNRLGATGFNDGKPLKKGRVKFQQYYGNTGFHLYGKHARIDIKPTRLWTNHRQIGLDYAWLRATGQPTDRFARRLLTVDLTACNAPRHYEDFLTSIRRDPKRIKRTRGAPVCTPDVLDVADAPDVVEPTPQPTPAPVVGGAADSD